MSLDSSPVDRPLEAQSGGSSPRLAVVFFVLLGLLGLLGLFSVSGTVVSAVDTLLGGPAQSCGGP